jgi:hypothetical protein
MPSDRTTVTELGTALGMLGLADIDEAVRSRTPVMHSLSPEMWERLDALRTGGAFDPEFHSAWANGQAFLAARDGLRGRLPSVVEWKGTGRAPGDDVAPIDLRVDHVYLVSCKYLSNILFNVSPAHVFDHLLAGPPGRASRATGGAMSPGGGDWYAEVAPREHQLLYESVRDAVAAAAPADRGRAQEHALGGPTLASEHDRRAAAPSLPGFDALDTSSTSAVHRVDMPVPVALRTLPARAVDLSRSQREALGHWLRSGWPDGAKGRYVALSDEVARASARRWNDAVAETGGAPEAMFWRLLRIGSAPYFVLGSSSARSLRLRIATSWDWRQRFKLLSFAVEAQPGGQPRVGWHAEVRDRVSHERHAVAGHVEVRWSHGRFGGLPEAKGYLDIAHHLVPGYFALR